MASAGLTGQSVHLALCARPGLPQATAQTHETLGQGLADFIEPHGYRVFADSAPVIEKHFAEQAGLGWIGKHTLILSRDAGSWCFIAGFLTDAPLPLIAQPQTPRCGSCSACIDVCPTAAIVEPYRLDARRCISYHTIELQGPIPEEFRAAMGNRVFGCDDCQLVCPWNRYAAIGDNAFQPRHGLDDIDLLTLFAWDEANSIARRRAWPFAGRATTNLLAI